MWFVCNVILDFVTREVLSSLAAFTVQNSYATEKNPRKYLLI